MNILLTGCAGFIASKVGEPLFENNMLYNIDKQSFEKY